MHFNIYFDLFPLITNFQGVVIQQFTSGLCSTIECLCGARSKQASNLCDLFSIFVVLTHVIPASLPSVSVDIRPWDSAGWTSDDPV
jgi:hypothetical protein